MSAALEMEQDLDVLEEQAACALSPEYFAGWCQIKDDQVWMPLTLWPAQREVLRGWYEGDRHVALKARQVGLSWLALLWALWQMIFRPGSTVLLLSLREEESLALLERLSGMLARLPTWLRPALEVDRAGLIKTAAGSTARALPSHRGDSYTASLVVVDEASLIPRLDKLLGSLEPTVADGGQILMVSRAKKSDPYGTFARVCRACLEAQGPWRLAFLPWSVHPDRDAAWYARQCEASLAASGNLDAVLEQYPATPAEALAPSAGDKRLTPEWLLACYRPERPLQTHALVSRGAPDIPGLRVYRPPSHGLRVVLGADPAAGLPTSDDSACVVLDELTGEEVASFEGKWEPTEVFPGLVARLAQWYATADGPAPVMVLENNHGHAVIGALARLGIPLLEGRWGRPGWVESVRGKVELYDDLAGEARRTHEARQLDPEARGLTIHSAVVYHQTASIERNTLRAPQGQHDDCADALAAANIGRAYAAQARTPLILGVI